MHYYYLVKEEHRSVKKTPCDSAPVEKIQALLKAYKEICSLKKSVLVFELIPEIEISIRLLNRTYSKDELIGTYQKISKQITILEEILAPPENEHPSKIAVTMIIATLKHAQQKIKWVIPTLEKSSGAQAKVEGKDVEILAASKERSQVLVSAALEGNLRLPYKRPTHIISEPNLAEHFRAGIPHLLLSQSIWLSFKNYFIRSGNTFKLIGVIACGIVAILKYAGHVANAVGSTTLLGMMIGGGVCLLLLIGYPLYKFLRGELWEINRPKEEIKSSVIKLQTTFIPTEAPQIAILRRQIQLATLQFQSVTQQLERVTQIIKKYTDIQPLLEKKRAQLNALKTVAAKNKKRVPQVIGAHSKTHRSNSAVSCLSPSSALSLGKPDISDRDIALATDTPSPTRHYFVLATSPPHSFESQIDVFLKTYKALCRIKKFPTSADLLHEIQICIQTLNKTYLQSELPAVQKLIEDKIEALNELCQQGINDETPYSVEIQKKINIFLAALQATKKRIRLIIPSNSYLTTAENHEEKYNEQKISEDRATLLQHANQPNPPENKEIFIATRRTSFIKPEKKLEEIFKAAIPHFLIPQPFSISLKNYIFRPTFLLGQIFPTAASLTSILFYASKAAKFLHINQAVFIIVGAAICVLFTIGYPLYLYFGGKLWQSTTPPESIRACTVRFCTSQTNQQNPEIERLTSDLIALMTRIKTSEESLQKSRENCAAIKPLYAKVSAELEKIEREISTLELDELTFTALDVTAPQYPQTSICVDMQQTSLAGTSQNIIRAGMLGQIGACANLITNGVAQAASCTPESDNIVGGEKTDSTVVIKGENTEPVFS